MRKLLVVIHRWFGLGMALFLFQAGLTGALIAWDHEIDALLNPELYESEHAADAPLLTALQLAEVVERDDPRLDVTFLPLAVEPGKALLMSVQPRRDAATGKPFELGFDQVAVDPSTGQIQGRRMWGELSLSRLQLMPFLYKLHYSMHLPPAFGIELGIWLMGIIAIIWLLDAFIALWISFPKRSAWKKSFAFRFSKGGYRLNFDLHRSGGVWAWLLLLGLAMTAVSMNLNREVVRPVVSLFSPLAESPFDARQPNPEGVASELRREQVLAQATSDARALGLEAPPGGVFYSEMFGVYGVGFYAPGNDHGEGLGNPWLYFDGKSGAPVGQEIPGQGSAGDLFMQLQFPLHSGRILGVAGRVAITALGLVVSLLSATGVVIWARKRRVRVLAEAKEARPVRSSPADVGIHAEPSA